MLKQIADFDPAIFSVDMLRKICGKLGFVLLASRKAMAEIDKGGAG